MNVSFWKHWMFLSWKHRASVESENSSSEAGLWAGGSYHLPEPSGRAPRALRPRWSRTCSLRTLGTGTSARPADQRWGNGGSAAGRRCWCAATLRCRLSSAESRGGKGTSIWDKLDPIRLHGTNRYSCQTPERSRGHRRRNTPSRWRTTAAPVRGGWGASSSAPRTIWKPRMHARRWARPEPLRILDRVQ